MRKAIFYFVDRIGDTFRRKGENVATSEVAAAICDISRSQHANVYGVVVPGVEGRVGMAALVPEAIWIWLVSADISQTVCRPTRGLCSSASASEVELTGTFKYSKTELVRQGYDPGTSTDPLYFDFAEADAFVPLDNDLYDRIQCGGIRL